MCIALYLNLHTRQYFFKDDVTFIIDSLSGFCRLEIISIKYVYRSLKSNFFTYKSYYLVWDIKHLIIYDILLSRFKMFLNVSIIQLLLFRFLWRPEWYWILYKHKVLVAKKNNNVQNVTTRDRYLYLLGSSVVFLHRVKSIIRYTKLKTYSSFRY